LLLQLLILLVLVARLCFQQRRMLLLLIPLMLLVLLLRVELMKMLLRHLHRFLRHYHMAGRVLYSNQLMLTLR